MKVTRRSPPGFTLIELMIVVAIMGVLASIAIPAFIKYVRRAKTTEAVVNLRKAFDGSVSYYDRDWSNRFGQRLPAQFPVSSPRAGTPGSNPCCGQPADKCVATPRVWNDPTWQALRFAIDESHYYWYQYASEGVDLTARFTARAMGNLNCNLTFSTFERIGRTDNQGNVVGAAGIFSVRPLE